MRSPIDSRFTNAQSLMKSGQMIGTSRPVGRVTFAKQHLNYVESSKKGLGYLRFLDTTSPEYELLTVRTIDTTRSIGQDAATCTVVMWNANAESNAPDGIDTEGSVGWLTPGRGKPIPAAESVYNDYDDFFTDAGSDQTYPTSWGFSENRWRDVLVPNTVLRTYQGYGSDNFDQHGQPYAYAASEYVPPEQDSQLYETGVWLIDNVTFATDGTISVECRDLGKLLIEQYIYPPMIPVERFPLIYCPAHAATGKKASKGRNVARVKKASGSSKAHPAKDASDSRSDSYWQSPPQPSSNDVAWLQLGISGLINEITIHAWKGNYTAYICIREGGTWQGSSKIGTSNNDDDTANDGSYFYVISSGDTLWDLAYRFYDNHLLWPRIAAVNSNIIKDPHWIYPGQRIKIPYIKGTKTSPPGNPSGLGGGGGEINYVMRVTIPKSGVATISLPRTYNAEYVRIVFTHLYKVNTGDYKVGVRTVTAQNNVKSTYVASTIGKAGYIQDWTEPVKELCAWAGLTWSDATPNPPDPVLGSATAAQTEASLNKTISTLRAQLNRKGLSASTKSTLKSQISSNQSFLTALKARGTNKPLRVWGDFEFLGAGPVVCTPSDYFLSKSFKEGIQQIVDFIGGIFYIDEFGGAQFRLPNIWTGGNFIDDTAAASSLGARISEHPIEFHEDANIVTYSAVISDADLRSEILVVGGYPNVHAKGPIAGGYVLGYNSATHTTSAIDFSNVLGGQYRLMVVPGDATNLFYTEAECQRMAELTALFILFTYRQGSLHAPCHPALQIDDQVRIFERISNEYNIHYVSGISTHQDLSTGEYTMDVTTHWLGGDPNTDWFVNKAQLTPAVKQLPAIIARIGMDAGGDVLEQPPYGTSGID